MARYAFLVLPSFNRVYADAAPRLAQAELAVFNHAVLGGRVSGIGAGTVAGAPYVTFDCDELAPDDVARLANLSFLYALFKVEGDLLRPLELRRLDRFDDDLLTILKYPGKTNEQFTKLLLNVTLLSSGFAPELLTRRFSVLDPLCGRGTTLNQAIMYGFDAYGVDADKKDVEAYAVFIQRWLKDKRLKHKAGFAPVRRNRQVVASRLHADFAATKDEYQAGDLQHLDVVCAESSQAPEFFRAESADLVVADAPYGVQHGSQSAARPVKRSPVELIAGSAPAWARTLRPGGALGISLNTFTARRDEVAAALSAAGLQVLEEDPYLDFRHRVDQAILRDIVIARKG